MNHQKVLNIISDICTSEGWNVSSDYVGNGWKADLLIEYTKYSVAINFYNRQTADVDPIIESMHNENVCGCWLGNSFHDYRLPIFRLYYKEKKLHFRIGEEYELNAEDFIKNLVRGKIRYLQGEKELINEIRILPIETKCYKCGTPYYAYFLYDFVTVNGNKYDVFHINNVDFGYNHDFTFDENMINILKEHHIPQLDLPWGVIKKRYSNTVQQSYLSFGCPECDFIYGNYYYREDVLEYANDVDEQQLVAIDVSKINLKLRLANPKWRVINE